MAKCELSLRMEPKLAGLCCSRGLWDAAPCVKTRAHITRGDPESYLTLRQLLAFVLGFFGCPWDVSGGRGAGCRAGSGGSECGCRALLTGELA